ncbi:hypothetical protein, partial [Enterococcus innesii]|uniref:hypothetical protein n=1 Tax=Enterococcus innesii TaxID=2839759 RepID=UPI003D0FE0E5
SFACFVQFSKVYRAVLATFISYQSDVRLSTLFLKVFSLVVFQLRSGCLSDFIRITNDSLFVNNFFQLILLVYQPRLTILKLRLRYNIICFIFGQVFFEVFSKAFLTRWLNCQR